MRKIHAIKKFRIFIARLVLPLFSFLIAAFVLIATANAAAPLLYKDPFRQSPVRGDPDDLLIIAGYGFAATDRVVYQRLADPTKPLVHPWNVPNECTANLGQAPIVSFANLPDSLTIRLPPIMQSGASYALWVVNNAGQWSTGVKINDPRPLWITPDVMYRSAAPLGLARQLKVIGRNLQSRPGFKTKVRLRGNRTYKLTAINDQSPQTSIEHYVALVDLPANMDVGTYQVDVQRNGMGWVTLQGQTLSVLPNPAPSLTFSVSSFGCVANDGLDDTPCVVDAIDAAASAGKGIVTFGPGVWELLDSTWWDVDSTFGIVVPVGVRLMGSGASTTTVRKGGQWNETNGQLDYRAVFTVQGDNEVTGIRFEDERSYQSTDWTAPFFLLGKLPWYADPGPHVVEHVTFTENVFARPFVAIGDGGFPIRYLHVTHNEFGAFHDALLLAGNRYIANFGFRVDDSIITNNLFKPGAYIDPAIYQGTIASHLGATTRMDFSNNVADGHALDFLDGSLPGWRAGFFWHMNNNHEMTLVAQNVVTCAGDKAGDGEAIAYDNNANTFGFKVAKQIVQATSTSVTVSTADQYPLETSQNGQLVPGNYYNDHWIQIANGVGMGQARKIVSYTVDPTADRVTFIVSPAWDVKPQSGSSMMTVAREFWQVYTVDNTVDIRGCTKHNQNGLKRYGVIGLGAMMTDSTVEGNVQYEAAGISLSPGYSVEVIEFFSSWECFDYFVEIRGNTFDDEPEYDSACSWSGISLCHGAASGSPSNMPPSPVVLGYGVSVAHNVISHADGIRGGAIVFGDTWWEPAGSRMYVNTLIYQNALSDLPQTSTIMMTTDVNTGFISCADDPVRGVGIHIKLPLIHSTVLSDNTFTAVPTPWIDNGTGTVQVL